jgi:hypothetical protein
MEKKNRVRTSRETVPFVSPLLSISDTGKTYLKEKMYNEDGVDYSLINTFKLTATFRAVACCPKNPPTPRCRHYTPYL